MSTAQDPTNGAPSGWFLASLAVLSAATLGYEILLMRLLSIVQWHHFAYMIISLALLGYGASGTFLTLAARWLTHRLPQAYFLNACGFAASSVICFILAQRIPFNPFELMWGASQSLYLLAMYLLLAIPFFCAANCVGIGFRRYSTYLHRVYCADLLGAGIGAIGIVMLLGMLPPEHSLRVLVLLGCAAAALSALDQSRHIHRVMISVPLLTLTLFAAAAPASWTQLQLSPYKGLSQTLAVMGSRLIEQRDGPIGRLSVVANDAIPFRIAPGVSLTSRAQIAPQLAVFSDGDGMSAITRFDGRLDPLAYLEDLSSALPYALVEQPTVLIVGAGGGSDLLQALRYGARQIDAVEFNPQMADLVLNQYAHYSGGLFRRADVSLHIADARHYIAGNTARYDLMQFALVDSFGTASAGIQSLNENYLYTVEALREYVRHLNPQGLIAITRWLKLPPRDSLKLVGMAIDALRAEGIEDPGRHLVMIRSWKTTTLLISPTPIDLSRSDKVREFCRTRAFDVVYVPGITPDEVNQFNILDSPLFYRGTAALLGEQRTEFIERYKFNIEPATDNKPYFFQFFKWGALPELLALGQQGGLPMLEWGYLVLIATLLQAMAVSAVLIVLPLIVLRKVTSSPRARMRVTVYFAALGLAYLFVEIAFIQKFILFLGHPVYSVAACICAFLIFSGLGSGWSSRFGTKMITADRRPTRAACLVVGGLILVYMALLPLALKHLMWLPDGGKFAAVFVLIGPLAFLMGMPFPLGLAQLAGAQNRLLPWAWGINGCASVISAVLAVVLAVHFGFVWVGLCASGLYYLASRVRW